MTVFVSYSSRDETAVKGLLSAFRVAQESVWWDEELGGGETWWRMILEQIRACDVFVLALSQNSLDSRSCQAELRYAQDLGKRVLPVQIGKVDSMRAHPFAATHIIDYRNPNVDTGIRLIADLRRQAASTRPLPDPLPPEPPMPYAYLMRMKAEMAGAQLNPQQQTQLFEELKMRLNEDGADASARADITRMLYALRSRTDTTDATRAAIDELLESLGLKRPGAQRFRKWILAGAAIVLIVIVAVAVLMVRARRHDSTAASTSPPPVEDSQLGAILLTPGELNGIMGTADITGGELQQTPSELAKPVSPPECAGVFAATNMITFQGSGFRDVRYQNLLSKATAAFINQGAITFPGPRLAEEFVPHVADIWRKCADQPVEVADEDGTATTWRLARLGESGSQLVQNATFQGGEMLLQCQHVLRAASNVVIEATVCTRLIGMEAVQIADRMTAKVTNPTK